MRLKSLLPIHKVHHISRSFGYALPPVLPWTVGVFEFGRSHDNLGNWNPKWRIRAVRTRHLHDCTATGEY